MAEFPSPPPRLNLSTVDLTNSKETSPIIKISENYAAISNQGKRISQEDFFSVFSFDSENFAKFGYLVIDGHGGKDSGQFVNENLFKLLNENLLNVQTVAEAKVLISESFKELEFMWKAVRLDNSGACILLCLDIGDTYLFANCGDCRAIVVYGKGTSDYGSYDTITTDHVPMLSTEHKRILNAGLAVINERVNGELAVSRSLGDFEYKGESENPEYHAVTVVPEFFSTPKSNAKIVLMTDGIHQKLSMRRIVDLCENSSDNENFVKIMMQECLEKGTEDNFTLIII